MIRRTLFLMLLALILLLSTACFQPSGQPGLSEDTHTNGSITNTPAPPGDLVTATSTSDQQQAPPTESNQPTVPPIAQTTTALASTMQAGSGGQATPTPSGPTPTIDPNAPTLPPTPTDPAPGGGGDAEADDEPGGQVLQPPDAGGECAHVLQAGENLFRLSLAWETTVEAIAELNGITNPDSVAAGTVLRIPGCADGGGQAAGGGDAPVLEGDRLYTIQQGDTLSRIAARFGVSVQDILDTNPELTDPSRIIAGEQIVIP